jgi:signal transduction histidine kinase
MSGPPPARRSRIGLQTEIVASLFVVMLAGLAIVAIVMGSLAVRSVELSTVERLRIGARQLLRAMGSENGSLADRAAVARALGPRVAGGTWTVLDAEGRELAMGLPRREARAEQRAVLAALVEHGELVRGGGFPPADLELVVPIEGPNGVIGALVGTVPAAELDRQLLPLLRSGSWVLGTAALVFVSFGSYLLRRRIVLRVQALSKASHRIAAGDLSARVSASGTDELAELAACFNEMTASLEAQRSALIEAQRSLSRSERLATTGRLAAGVAHEVGNPVSAVLGYVDVALRECARIEPAAGAAQPRLREHLDRIRQEALRVRALVRELLDLARSQELACTAVEPAALLQRAADRMRAQPLLAGIELSVEVEAGTPRVWVDPRRVEQVLVNLIENAAHALAKTERPGIRLVARPTRDSHHARRRRSDAPDAEYAAQRGPSAVALEVVDGGPGIDPEHLPHVFDPFFTTKDPGQGTGLGLWNAHRIAELLGGRLEVASRPGLTCFSLILPEADTRAGHAEPARPDHRR